MPQTRNRNPSPVPEAAGLKEMDETWKGAIACLGVAVFFVMTIGVIYWQVVDQPNKNWILKGSFSGLTWEGSSQALAIQTIDEDKTFVEIDVGIIGDPDSEVPFARNLCWLNKTEFCYTWDSFAEVKIALETSEEAETECYTMTWTPVNCHVQLKDCFSMTNVSWYGGASVYAPNWPINDMDVSMQAFTISDMRDNPSGFGSVLERYFLGSSGVAIVVAPHVQLHVGMIQKKQFCLQTGPDTEQTPLQYSICLGQNIKAIYQESIQRLSKPVRELPNMNVLRLPFWQYTTTVNSGAKVERELRTFSNQLKSHHLEEGVISLDEHSTFLLSTVDHDYLSGRKRSSKRETRDLPYVKHLNISVTLSPYLCVDSRQFQTSMQDETQDYWLSLPSGPQAKLIPLLTHRRGKHCVKLNLTNPDAINWFLDKVDMLYSHLGMEYIILEGGEGDPFEEQALPHPHALKGDAYIGLLAELAEKIGDNIIMSAGTRSSHKPLFVRMSALQPDWSYAGLKGIIPSLLHHSLLGYNFFIPDAVGGSLSIDIIRNKELFLRWLQIVTFLPVLSFQTLPWAFGEDEVMNITRFYIAKHQNFVVPLIEKYAKEWQTNGDPIYRPLWWISPDDPITFTIDDEFLIGDRVLVAPVTEEGALERDIYLPEGDFQWQDTNNAEVFDGGTFLQGYPVGFTEVPVFVQML